jgi:prevent-host-death family protein
MQIVNIHEAKTHLSRLIDQAIKGEPFIIAKAGKPLVTVARIETENEASQRFDFMAGRISVPDDFDTRYNDYVEHLFYGEE